MSFYAVVVQRQASDVSVNSTRLQSIYERALDVDRLLADKPEIAQIVFQADAKSAAEIYVLDYDQYVWNNIRQVIKPDAQRNPDQLALRRPPADNAPDPNAQFSQWKTWNESVIAPVPKMPDWSDSEWEQWTTWSETIAGGFRPMIDEETDKATPSDLCRQLNAGRDAYGNDLVAAIVNTKLCPVQMLPASP